MRFEDNQLFSQPRIWSNYVGCKHSTELDRAVMDGRLAKIHRTDVMLELLIELGERHEQQYKEYLKSLAKHLWNLSGLLTPMVRRRWMRCAGASM